MASITFDVLIDDRFLNLCDNPNLKPIDKKWVLTLLNDYEEGEWRKERFLDYIWNNIAQTALSKKERDDLIEEPRTTTRRAARNIRLSDNDKIGRGSEISEILLYGVMKDYFHAIPVVPKIFHKQNPKDNAKGADCVHILLSDDKKDFSLWFGEAKFFKSLSSDNLNDLVNSIKNSLDKDNIRKENSIITDLAELDLFDMPDETREKIKDFLKQDTNINIIRPKLHIPIMLLHQCGKTKAASDLNEHYKEIITRKHIKKANEYFKMQVDTLSGVIDKYGDISFHLILFPIPDKDEVVNEFIDDVARLRR